MLFALSQCGTRGQDVDQDQAKKNSKLNRKKKRLTKCECGDRKIIVIIGSSKEMFCQQRLSQLTYFESLFLRWHNNVENNIEAFPPMNIDINSDKENHNNSNNNNSTCTNTSSVDEIRLNVNFSCGDLRLLLWCIENKHIPIDSELNLSELESLLECQEYFNPSLRAKYVDCSNSNSDNNNSKHGASFVIDENVLFDYFGRCVPGLDDETRKKWMMECQHKLLRASLTKLVYKFGKMVDELPITQDSSNPVSIPSKSIFLLLESLESDPAKACNIFETRFKLICLKSRRREQNGITIKIKDFEDAYIITNENENKNDEKESVLFKLWELCDNGEYLSARRFENIDEMIGLLLDPSNKNERIITRTPQCRDQLWLVLDVLEGLIYLLTNRKMLIDDTRLINTKFINVKSLSKAILIICSCSEPWGTTLPPFLRHQQVYKYMTPIENESLLDCIIEQLTNIFKRIASGKDAIRTNEASLYELKCDIDRWTALLGSFLIYCRKHYVIKTAPQWFVLLHEKPRAVLLQVIDYIKQKNNYQGSIDGDGGVHVNNGHYKDGNVLTDEIIESVLKLKNNIEEENAQWVLKHLFKKVSTKDAFEFGIFLANYICYYKPSQEKYRVPFPKTYSCFIKKHLGITWKLTNIRLDVTE